MFENAARKVRTIVIVTQYIIMGIIAVGGLYLAFTAANVSSYYGKSSFNFGTFLGILFGIAIAEVLYWMSCLFIVAFCDLMVDVRAIRENLCGPVNGGYATPWTPMDLSKKTSAGNTMGNTMGSTIGNTMGGQRWTCSACGNGGNIGIKCTGCNKMYNENVDKME